MDRNSARWKIIRAANKFKMRDRVPMYGRIPAVDNKIVVAYREPTLFGMRQIQRAVFLCRQRGLVSGDVLRAAGFNG